MPSDLTPENILDLLEKGKLGPLYLFHGPGEFRLEKVLTLVRETFIPEGLKDLNLQIFYGDEANSADVVDAARSLPFMAERRLIIVRRTEDFSTDALEGFIPYLDRPAESTCLIFLSSSPDFRKKFYKKLKAQGQAVNFKKLYDNQVVPWIRKMAKDLGVNLEAQACVYLHHVVGNKLRDLHTELEKLYLRYGDKPIGMKEVEALAIYSRVYTIFELVDAISFKRRAESLAVLNRLIEKEGKDALLGVLGMFIRQFQLLRQAKPVISKGGRELDVASKLHVPAFVAKKIIQQSKYWSIDDLERAFSVLYNADGLLKSGSQRYLVFEKAMLSLCS